MNQAIYQTYTALINGPGQSPLVKFVSQVEFRSRATSRRVSRIPGVRDWLYGRQDSYWGLCDCIEQPVDSSEKGKGSEIDQKPERGDVEAFNFENRCFWLRLCIRSNLTSFGSV